MNRTYHSGHRSFKGVALSLIIFALVLTGGVRAYELFTTTAGLIRTSPHIAHVRVDSASAPDSLFGVVDFQVTLIENLKGRLPNSFPVRLLISSRIVEPDGKPDPAGSEWILILGKKNSNGFYPLRSLNWGKIEIFRSLESGEKLLARKLTGFPASSTFRGDAGGAYITLDNFKKQVRRINNRR